MKQISRRHFIQAGLIGAAAITTGFSNAAYMSTVSSSIDKVKLGKTGLLVPRLALGTGTHGGNQSSDIEPGASFVGGGSYCPPAEALKAFRTEIFDHPEDFRQLISNDSFLKVYPDMYYDKLKTAPKGFPKDFPEIDLLNYKSYAFTSRLDDSVVTSDEYVGKIVAAMKELYPVNRFLNIALEKWL